MCIEKPEEEIDEYLKSKSEQSFTELEIRKAIEDLHLEKFSIVPIDGSITKMLASFESDGLIQKLKSK